MIHRSVVGFWIGACSALFFFAGLFLGAVSAQEAPANHSQRDVIRLLDLDADYFYYANAAKLVDTFIHAALIQGELRAKEVEEVRNFMDTAGLDEIEALGYSHKTHADGVDLNLVIAKSPAADPTSGPWSVFPKTDSPLAGIERLPKDSVWAVYGNMNPKALLVFLQTVFPPLAEEFDVVLKNNEDVPLQELLDAISGTSWGFALTMNPEKLTEYPIGEQPIPEIGFVATFHSPGPVVGEWLRTSMRDSLGEPEALEKGDASVERFPVLEKVPGEPQLQLISQGESITFTTCSGLVDQITIGDNTSLADNPAFRDLSARLPDGAPANLLHFISPQLLSSLAPDYVVQFLDEFDMLPLAPFLLKEKGPVSGIASLTHRDQGLHLAARATGSAMPLAVGVPTALSLGANAVRIVAELGSVVTGDMKTQGKNIYTVVLMDRLSDRVVGFPQAQASSTQFFNDLLGLTPDNTINISSDLIFTGRGEPRDGKLKPENVAWCVVTGQDASTPAGTPFLFTRNLEFTEDHKPKVNPDTIYGDTVVVVTHGGWAGVFKSDDPKLPELFDALPYDWDSSKVLRP